MELLSVADELYGMLPSEFVKARTARVKEARAGGDRELAQDIGDLPKPSVSAWAVNALVRHRADLVEQVLELGAELRDAHEHLDRDELRALNVQRQQLTTAVAQQGSAVGEELGQRVSAAATSEVQQTLHAAMADPAAADAVRSGRLLRTIFSNGLEPADLDGAVAVPDAASRASTERSRKRASHPRTSQKKTPPRDEVAARREQKEAERKAKQEREARRVLAAAEREERDAGRESENAHGRLEDAEHHVEKTESRRGRFSQERDRLQRRLEEIRSQLEEIRSQLEEAEAELSGAEDEALVARDARDQAERAAREAEAARRDAEKKSEQARKELEQLT